MVRCQKRRVAKFLGLFRLLDPLFPRCRFPDESETERFACHLLSSFIQSMFLTERGGVSFFVIVLTSSPIPRVGWVCSRPSWQRASFLFSRRQGRYITYRLSIKEKENIVKGRFAIRSCSSALSVVCPGEPESVQRVTSQDGERKAPRPAHRTART